MTLVECRAVILAINTMLVDMEGEEEIDKDSREILLSVLVQERFKNETLETA